MLIPGAVHTDLYDRMDVIPFDKIRCVLSEISEINKHLALSIGATHFEPNPLHYKDRQNQGTLLALPVFDCCYFTVSGLPFFKSFSGFSHRNPDLILCIRGIGLKKYTSTSESCNVCRGRNRYQIPPLLFIAAGAHSQNSLRLSVHQ